MNDTIPLDELSRLAAARIGLRVPEDSRGRFADMIGERAERLGFASMAGYRAFLAGERSDGEWEEFARAFTTGESFFFRDRGQFDLLRLRLLPELIERNRAGRTLRLWSAGCAGGEEAYSLAMLVDMLLPERGGWDILVLGTDIDSKAIDKARRGRYGPWSFRAVPPEWRRRYFSRVDGDWLVDESMRRMAAFRVSNLVGEAFPSPASELRDMDLILCRNVFIYFDPAAVSAVASKFAATLREGGYLMTAHTELMGHPTRGLNARLFADGIVYQRRGPAAVPRPAPVAKPTPTRVPPPAPVLAAPDGLAFVEEARRLADRGDYAEAERACDKAREAAPLAAAPLFLSAQLAQLKGDFDLAKDRLSKALYLDPSFAAAHLELAALCERGGDMARARALRRAALDVVRSMPSTTAIEQYETTAGELARWLAQWEDETP